MLVVNTTEFITGVSSIATAIAMEKRSDKCIDRETTHLSEWRLSFDFKLRIMQRSLPYCSD